MVRFLHRNRAWRSGSRPFKRSEFPESRTLAYFFLYGQHAVGVSRLKFGFHLDNNDNHVQRRDHGPHDGDPPGPSGPDPGEEGPEPGEAKGNFSLFNRHPVPRV